MTNEKVIVIAGPTAVGKTELSIRLAKELNGEIINGDALQVYKGLDVGTAKITADEMEGVPHHLLSFLEPTEAFSVAEYQRIVRVKIEEIVSRKKVPIIVGGTGLYIQAVLFDFQFASDPQDVNLRNQLEQLDADEVWNRLLKQDPVAANTIHPNNKQRTVRALERALLTGKTQQEYENNVGQVPLYPFILFGLERPREELYERINERVYRMLERGLISEVQDLLQKVPVDAQSMSAIGYKEVVKYLHNQLTNEEMIQEIQQNSRRYAKRQFTYFRNKLPVEWVHPEKNQEKIIALCKQFLQDS